jgi:ElaB/YqjD/DUF883 family membrane-anchored ribosome-binding protein
MDEATNKMSAADWDDDDRIASGSSDDYTENTELIRAGIEDTRAEMSQTINEIQERLSPEHLMGQVKETVREATIGKVERVMDKVGETIGGVAEPAREAMDRAGTAIKETSRTVADSVWKNPIPVALIGLGLGMLAMRRWRSGNGHGYDGRHDYDRRTTPRVKRPNTLGQMQTETTGTLDQVKETASDLATRSTNALSDLGTKAKDSVSTIGTRFGQVLRENPLAVGAVAVAAGTAVGLVLPSTKFESEYIGEASERLVDKAEDAARGALDKVQSAAQQLTAE